MNVFILYFPLFLQDDADDHDCKLDLEDVLDLDTDSERRQYAIVSIQLRRGMRFPTMWHFDMCRLGRASAASC